MGRRALVGTRLAGPGWAILNSRGRMPDLILNCPQCRRPLRVPDTLLDRLVQCPACRITFAVPSARATPAAEEPPTVEPVDEGPSSAPPEPVPGEAFWESTSRSPVPPAPVDERRARMLLLPPAICLLLVTFLGLLADLGMVVLWTTMPDQLEQQMNEMSKQLNLGPPGPAAMHRRLNAAFAAYSVIILVANIQMLRLRMYGLAVVGCFLPMLNLGSNCCCLGVPIGIWAFIVLMRPDVRAAFR